MPGVVANWQLKQYPSSSGSGSNRSAQGNSSSRSSLLEQDEEQQQHIWSRHVSSFAFFNEPWSSFNMSGDFGSQYATLLDEDKRKQIHVTTGSYFGGSSQQQQQQQQQSKQQSRSGSSSSSSWRTAGSEELAALVAQKSVERIANCDLPPPTATPEITPRAALVASSPGSTTTNCALGSVGRDLLGEALCRSQSRAREADKFAVGAFHDKDKLMRLFLQEASVSFAYRQWLISLQAENMCLKMCQQARHNAAVTSSTARLIRKKNRQQRRGGHHHHQHRHRGSIYQYKTQQEQHKQQQQQDADVRMRCTIAFALGLSLASAGFLLGWGMGWIFLATCVS